MAPRSFGYADTDGDAARAKAQVFLTAIDGAAVATTDPARTGISGGLAIQPQSPGLRDRIWWGAGTRATAQWAARAGMNLQSSTLLSDEAVQAADTVLFTVPNQLGVAYNARILETIAKHIAPAAGWAPHARA